MVAFRCSRVYTLLVATSRALWRTSQTSFPYNERVSLQAVVRNLLANHSEGSAFGSHLRPRLQLSQRNRTIGTVHAAEQFRGVLSAATPRSTGSTAKWSRLQAKISPRAPVHIMGAGHTKRIGNEKSAFRHRTPVSKRFPFHTRAAVSLTGAVGRRMVCARDRDRVEIGDSDSDERFPEAIRICAKGRSQRSLHLSSSR